MNGGTTRIAKIAFVVLALLLGTATATALARNGADDGTSGTTGTTGTTQTGTTPTTTTPAPAPARKVRVVGIVSARDEGARTFTLKVKNRKPLAVTAHAKHRKHKPRATRVYTVQAGELAIPAVGRQVLVKGTLDGTTIAATRIKVLRGDDNPHRHNGDDHRRGDDDHGRGRGSDDPAGDDRGRGKDDDHGRGRGDDDRGGDRGRGRDHAEDD